MNSHNDENQMLLDELLNQNGNKQMGAGNSMANFLDFYDDIQHSSSVTKARESQQQQQQQAQMNTRDSDVSLSTQNTFVYPGSNPAMQHEKMAYMNQNNNNNNNPHEYQSLTRDMYGGAFSHKNNDEVEVTNASFLDDMFTTSAHASQQQQQQQQHHQPQHQFNNMEADDGTDMSRQGSIAVSISNNSYAQSFTDEHMPHDLFTTNPEDQMINFADDLSSSLGSSIHSGFHTSNLGTPTSSMLNAHNLDTINSLTATSYNQNNTFSPSSLRSPSSSFRPNASYLSTSLRQPSTLSNYNANNSSISNNTNNNNNNNIATPTSRHPSTSGTANGGDSLLSTSVPKSLSHLSHEEKLRRKRDFHNAVERRRRDLIKQKISELGNLVPPALLCFDEKGKPVKPNKGIILNKTVDYVRFLMDVGNAQDHKKDQLLRKINELEEKFNNIDLKGAPTELSESVGTARTLTSKNNSSRNIQHIAEGDERIIDSRAYPNLKADIKSEIHDDLNQFLSGNILEAQDNAQLMFGDPMNDNNGNPADYLLEFDS
ncbi:similar to Saccharomyces cerevisiae YBL103C RTG3 Basic helix-loop-helix-leucine zipper (bHLH/Zip) transcription factor that forms a complex with another bHLH/Zip protein [Maudiozyma saulgeensis]|uniref:Similar to Saccharomyces cerevisiae YBL103C RTG3 Basic helix-loop-helix-leucine zipper (BHLH/Zip) transcription factor that forms a complex with another bHLH/Zip protein n=1 Tax=Maudiozyma saulgeensis TaxID=1789683 RepID=A0A1X7R6S6_9SACH|nr:similar to Saccharomyces cerevisiae YBL103C RTG3 Basic helix-loop-helix-leucine zipper (bHLH/Zip) transcription factor that forms a complex with another bHLH/Zip protein [Kazachstania saulgeensis]